MSAPCGGEEKNLGSTDDPILKRLNERLIASEKQNKRLKDLLVYNLDLIQQQNDLISRNEKLYQALRQENEAMKNKLNRRHGLNLPPPLPPPSSAMIPTSAPSIAMKTESSEILFSSFNELLMPENSSNSFLFDSDLIKPEEIDRGTLGFPSGNPSTPDIKPFMTCDIKTPPVMESTKSKCPKIQYEDFKEVSDNRALTKKEEPQLAVSTANTLMEKIKKDKRKITMESLNFNYTPENSAVVNKPSELINALQEYDYFGINRKNKVLNTYSKMRTATTTCTITSTTNTSTPKCSSFGSLSDRFQLIDTTPTGEDPYLLGEADLKQSPIPKLMLQKTNHGRLKVLDQPTRRIYDPDSSAPNTLKARTHRFLTSTTDQKKEADASITEESKLRFVKSASDIEWQPCQSTSKTNPDKVTSAVPPLALNELSSCKQSNIALNVSAKPHELQKIFTSTSDTNIGELTDTTSVSTILKMTTDRSSKQAARTAELSSSLDSLENTPDFKLQETPIPTTTKPNKRRRKRQRSSNSFSKGGKGGKGSKGGKGAKSPTKRRSKKKTESAIKKTPFPEKTTKIEYHTYVGDPDLSWYFGLDTEIKTDDIDQSMLQKAVVEVPRWREKICVSIDTSEGTENLDNKMFEKRHHKFEAEERRQLRWHMRRIREQRHLEKLKQRQMDTWSTTTVATPPVYTVWPRPQKDIQFIEITDTLPVMAFGEPIPELPDEDFMLPWVRTSDALKKSKRSKTLH